MVTVSVTGSQKLLPVLCSVDWNHNQTHNYCTANRLQTPSPLWNGVETTIDTFAPHFFFNSQIQWHCSPCRWICLGSILNCCVFLLISFLISTENSQIYFIFQNQLLERIISISLVLIWSFVYHLFSKRLNVWDKKFPLSAIQSFSTQLLSPHPVLDGGWSLRMQWTPIQTWRRPGPALPCGHHSESRASLALLKCISPLPICPEHKLKTACAN